MKKLILFTTLFVLFLVFVLPAIVALGIKLVPGGDQPGYSVNERRSLYYTYTATQEFTAQDNNLAAIGMTIGNPNLNNKKEIILKLFEDDNLVASSTVNGFNIPDGNFTRFIFEPIADSLGKTYTFALASPDARETDVIYVYFTSSAPEWVGDLSFVEGEVFPEGKLSFVAYHKPVSRMALLRQIYSDWLGRIVGR